MSADAEIIDAEFQEVTGPEVTIAGFTEADVQKMMPIVRQFLSSYAEKPKETSMLDWLGGELKKSLEEKSPEEIMELSAGIIRGVEKFTQNLSDLNTACDNGQTKENWLRENLKAAAEEKGLSVEEYGGYLANVNRAISDSNQAMMDAIESKGGTISLDIDAMREEVPAPAEGWNQYNTAALASAIGKQASLSGIGGAALTTGFNLAFRAAKGEPISGASVIKAALASGSDEEVKEAAAGALKVGIERGYVPFLPKNISAGAVANIACIGVENMKVFSQYSRGEINGVQALERMARNAVATVTGLSCEGMGTAIGATLFSFVPVVGTTVGGIIGGLVGRLASTKIGQAVQAGIQKIRPVAVQVAKTTWNTVKSAASTVWNTVKSVGKAIASFFGF